MNKRRGEKLAEEIKREISAILMEDTKDPRLKMVTVTRVEISNDLGHARVFVSVLGDEDRQKEALQGLERAQGFIRSEVGSRIRLRQVPELDFVLDRSIEHGIRIASLLAELKRDGKADE